MQIALKAKNRKLSETEEDLIRKKVSRLPRYLDQITEAEVIIGQERPRRGADQQVVQLTVRANGTLLRAEESDPEMQAALDAALAKVERRIERFRGRRERNKKGRSSLGEALVPPAPEGESEDEDTAARAIVRTKRFVVQPMEREDAAEQMELLGHSFFVYMDAETKHMSVLYRRQDGNYGLLEPVLT
jgi:ribosome hibernation promoting factor